MDNDVPDIPEKEGLSALDLAAHLQRDPSGPEDTSPREILDEAKRELRNLRDQFEQGGPRSTDGPSPKGDTRGEDGPTKQEVLSSERKLAEFMSEYDDPDEASEALHNLPTE